MNAPLPEFSVELIQKLFHPLHEGESIDNALKKAYLLGKGFTFKSCYERGRFDGFKECLDMVRHRLQHAMRDQTEELVRRMLDREIATRKTHNQRPIPSKEGRIQLPDGTIKAGLLVP